MNVDSLVAIDVHTHAEVSSRDREDATARAFQDAAQKYFKHDKPRPTIPEIAAYYRERKIGCVIFSVDGQRARGLKAVSNEEVAELAAENDDIMIPFASIDPGRGHDGVREARRLIEHYGVRGFKFHPQFQEFTPNDRMAYPLYEVIAEAKLPAIFHTGHSGMGTGMPGGGGIRLKYGDPMLIDDVAVDFPDMPIVLAHPSWPWQDQALSMCLHKPQVYIDLSGWSPKYFPPQLVHYANTLLKRKVLFGTDYPLLTPERWLADFEQIDVRPEVRPLILKQNAVELLELGAA
ncbi:MAG TPA: amidohydrolase family protein [Gammaproteobacteria bacterium]|nr:amidohydrolase family protein [Gammaproteobacteria bacterium]